LKNRQVEQRLLQDTLRAQQKIHEEPTETTVSIQEAR